MVRGGGFRAHSVYGLTDSFGISLEGGRSWYQGYSVELAKAGDQMDTDSGEDESEEDTEQKEQERSSFSKKRSRTSSLSLSVVYALDVMRAMPFLSIGVTSFRIEDETDDKRTVDYEIGLRFCIGVEYMLSERFALGVLGGYDRFVTDTHDYKGDISLTARISFVIGAGRFKIR